MSYVFKVFIFHKHPHFTDNVNSSECYVQFHIIPVSFGDRERITIAP